jgi:hypothetical protein
MAVYVDDARIPARGLRWSQLVADSEDGLHDAAAALGLHREWVHDRGRTIHYDLPEHVRREAIERGVAQPLPWRELVRRRATFSARG